MEPSQARELTDRYFASWLSPDLERFLSCLHPSAVVRECTGSVYEGRDEHTSWFAGWNSGGNRVNAWEIHSFGCDPGTESAFVEWTFNCTYEGADYEWYGASILRFRQGLIAEINEYERKK